MIRYLTIENIEGKRFSIAYSDVNFHTIGIPVSDSGPNSTDPTYFSDFASDYPAAAEFRYVTYYVKTPEHQIAALTMGFTDVRIITDDFPLDSRPLKQSKILKNGIWTPFYFEPLAVDPQTIMVNIYDTAEGQTGATFIGTNAAYHSTIPHTDFVMAPLNVMATLQFAISPTAVLVSLSTFTGSIPHFHYSLVHYVRTDLDYTWVWENRDNNPYDGAPDSDGGGGGGTYDNDSDPIPLPEMPPTLNGSNSFTTLWIPTTAQLNAIGEWFWTDDILINIKKLFADIVSAVLSLHVIPITISEFNIAIFNVAGASSDIECRYITNQFYDFDCGSLTIDKYYGSALDQSPHTSYLLYLPFVGSVSIDTDEIVGKTISIRYRIDVVTGGFICYVLINNNVFYTYTGSCSISIPISSANYGDMLLRLLGNAADSVSLVAKNGLSAPVAIGAGVQLALNVMNAKPSISHSGTLSEAYGWLGVTTPYLVIKRPRLSMPKNYQAFGGFPSNMTAKLGDLKGFTVVEQIHIENTNLLEEEIQMVENLLKAGVIL